MSDSQARKKAVQVQDLCPLCGAPVGDQVRIHARPERWSYGRCGVCRALSLNPIPDEDTLRSYYNETYSVPPERYALQTAHGAPPILREMGKRLSGKGKLLEIGCSWGFFLDAARREGWDAAGIELDGRAVRHGREKLGLKIFSGTLESEMTRLEPPYDAIATFHVIEHLRDPVDFLRRCRELLREGGLLILKTPNIASWIAKRTGAYWEWLSPPAHIHLFSAQTLHLALLRSGFRVERIWSSRGDAHNHLFQLVRALSGSIAARKRATKKNEAADGKWCSGSLSRWKVNAALAASEVIYYPLGLVLDPWLEKKGLQPELVAIATTL
jgi:2-polyprenyl-3-methyl-5-hydroxy-6-metoxy-1,4-benzoquinol methylase